ncbi:MAG: type IV toxin-antitoxin system AbiEi family antitoxin domain-containing protein [Thermoleophilaceae bacterium]
MRPQSSNVHRAIARIAGRAKGVVTRSELMEAGLSAGQVKRRVRSGLLIPEFPGVYRVGHAAASTEAKYMAAVKACGEGAALSGLAAAHRMGLIKGRPPAPEVAAPARREIRGILTHESSRIERWTFDGIPTTTVARTLVDLAGRLTEEELTLACHRAQANYGTTPRQVEQVLQHRPTTRGANKLRRAIRGETHVSLSALERKFLRRLGEANLPLPDETNQYAGTKRVDCRWRKQKLTVELDSYTFHNTRHAFEQDRRREREAYARGDDFRRYTWGDVFEDAAPMLKELAGLL